jgi:uncharacterized protein YfbU (UPF0304 family)
MVEVLDYGFTGEYYQAFQMLEPELTDRECSLVHDILEMFTRLEWSLENLGAADRVALGEDAEIALTFRGFDFNNAQEGRLAGYAHFLIKDDKYESMAKYFDAQHERGNSHMPTLATYQRMLSVWKPIWDRKIKSMGGGANYGFTAPELTDILAAWRHPSRSGRST